MKAAVELNDVTKRFRRTTALDQATLSVAPGTVHALLGENGAGKTTAIKILLGLLAPDHGAATVIGYDSRKLGGEIRRRVGYVPERPALYDWMTIEEIGWFTAGFYPAGFLDRYRELANDFGLNPRQKIKEASKGMQAKVSLALALAHQPEVLILDEPTSGLDPIVRRDFLESMVEVAADGRTVLLSSHQIDEVERVADHVTILRQGRVVLSEPLELLKKDTIELTLTMAGDSRQAEILPDLNGRILGKVRRDRQWRVLTRGADLDLVSRHPSVSDVQVRHPKLEEIFVAYMKAS